MLDGGQFGGTIMSGKIDDSVLQVRYDFFYKLMNHIPATPLTAYEMQVAQNMSKIRIYDEVEDFSLIQLISEIKNRVSIRDALFLLIDAYDMGVADNALDILENIAEQDLKISTTALIEIFTESLNGLVPHLMIDLLGDEIKPQEPIPTRLPSSLNLEAMKNFK